MDHRFDPKIGGHFIARILCSFGTLPDIRQRSHSAVVVDVFCPHGIFVLENIALFIFKLKDFFLKYRCLSKSNDLAGFEPFVFLGIIRREGVSPETDFIADFQFLGHPVETDFAFFIIRSRIEHFISPDRMLCYDIVFIHDNLQYGFLRFIAAVFVVVNFGRVQRIFFSLDFIAFFESQRHPFGVCGSVVLHRVPFLIPCRCEILSRNTCGIRFHFGDCNKGVIRFDSEDGSHGIEIVIGKGRRHAFHIARKASSGICSLKHETGSLSFQKQRQMVCFSHLGSSPLKTPGFGIRIHILHFRAYRIAAFQTRITVLKRQPVFAHRVFHCIAAVAFGRSNRYALGVGAGSVIFAMNDKGFSGCNHFIELGFCICVGNFILYILRKMNQINRDSRIRFLRFSEILTLGRSENKSVRISSQILSKKRC